MGLGKTIEIIDLILTNSRPAGDDNREILVQGEPLRTCKATVIITPPTICAFPTGEANKFAVSQWAAEFEERAPTLKVFVYPGIQTLGLDFDSDSLLDCDVILTTYVDLSKEIHYAKPPPNRSMRYEQTYKPRRSPLMEFEWWRVCLDEAQMIEGSVTSAATVACLMPRVVPSLQNFSCWWLTSNRMRGVSQGRLARKMFLISMDYSYFSDINLSLVVRRCGHEFVTTGIFSPEYFNL
jgi:E3 ubiquitin-protein ligase SHPRH